ncbi:similar to Saccharomyces cerevisiae YER042W MXR1 Methionine-S-sulfoxide reductase [Geotrichum candidum]|uniref:peptide-methionine (S)-S-oxide reductase n=2 Tax=Geotrichum candidum TaxID=1173061 RepID=A0A0J9X2X2_GEOCN|nr:similar to Saccharomyces cerevisiae YER042W MXR1 Methionine-S-sulfoxide reductase [Geotrichum candidum]
MFKLSAKRFFTTTHRTMTQFGPISPSLNVPEGAQVTTVGAGCFWGVEHMYRKYFENKGLIDCRVGYSGGSSDSPDYKTVCSDTTGHAEVLQISFNPDQVTLNELLDFFFRMHDPTTLNQQGPDTGSQYRSVVFTHNEEQSRVAREVRDRIQKEFYPNHKIVTDIVPISVFWDAEDYHQLYLSKNPTGYACPSHFLRTKPQL